MNDKPSSEDTVVSWIGWHIGELAGVIVPGVVALTVTPWAAVVSGVVGAGWAIHEIRLARRQAAIRAAVKVPALEAVKSDGATDDAPPDQAARWGEAR